VSPLVLVVQGKPVPSASLKSFLDAARANARQNQTVASVDASKLSDQELVEAVLFPVVNEALRIRAEGFAKSDSDIDVVSVMGYGYPAWRGGMLHWAENLPQGGYKYIAKRLQEMSTQWSQNGKNQKVAKFFEPCELLLKKAQEQK
jgi:hypothetical protein